MAMGQAIDLSEFGDFIRNIAKEIEGNHEQFFAGLYPKTKMVLVSQTKMAFHNSASPSGIPWKPLAHQRVRGGGTPMPLRDTGELMASMTANGPGHIDRREGIFLVFGSVHVRAWHNNGGIIRAVKAKFLCIPATREAFYAGSPRNFPGKLFFLWNEERGKGVAVGQATDYRQQQDQAEKYNDRVKKIKALMKQPARLGGVRRARRARFKLLSLKSWMGLARRLGKKTVQSKFWKRIKKYLGFGKKKKKTKSTARIKAKAFPAKKKNKPGQRVVHYYLTKEVKVPARVYLEITIQTEEKLSLIAEDHATEYIEGKFYGES